MSPLDMLQVTGLTSLTVAFQVRIWAVMLVDAQAQENARRARLLRESIMLSETAAELIARPDALPGAASF